MSGSAQPVARQSLSPFRLIKVDDLSYALTLDTADSAVNSAVQAVGHEPNGPFWEGVAQWLIRTRMPRLAAGIEYNSEADFFEADSADQAGLRQLGVAMAQVATSPDRARSLIEDAEVANFPFDD